MKWIVALLLLVTSPVQADTNVPVRSDSAPGLARRAQRAREAKVKVVTGAVFVTLAILKTLTLGVVSIVFATDSSNAEPGSDGAGYAAIWGIGSMATITATFAIGVPLLAKGMDEERQLAAELPPVVRVAF